PDHLEDAVTKNPLHNLNWKREFMAAFWRQGTKNA
ncbi:hypothetical protein ACM0EX_23185, partial [Salmonella enterica]